MLRTWHRIDTTFDRAGIVKSVEHTSLGDAGDVAELVLKKLSCN